MATVYLETSFVSACVTDRTDAGSVYRRDISQRWWATQRKRHNVVVSIEVLRELSDKRFLRRDEALALVEDLPLLTVNDAAEAMAATLVREHVMPSPTTSGDAVHVAVAAAHEVRYILSWNVRHLANAAKQKHLTVVCGRFGVRAPIIVTPDQLWEHADE